MSIGKHLVRSATVAAAVLFAVSANAALTTGIDIPAKPMTLTQSKDLFAKKGADDTKKDDRGRNRGRGRDDGPNHASVLKLEDMQMARRGADDAPGHIRHGRGADDAPGHIRHGRGADDSKGSSRRGRGSDDRSGDDHGGRRA